MANPRVIFTEKAIELINLLKKDHGALMFHQSGGCCDGSQPMCFQKGEFYLGSSDVCLGVIEDCQFWMNKDQFEYLKHTHLTMDVIPGRGSSFSLEIPYGFRFVIQSRLFTDQEMTDLEPLKTKEEFND
ncbi:MAG: hypothetical protein RLZZ30_476 [Bacteroidota bacterium]|jgi:uncharacterized protein (DUF779 family)